METLFDYLKWMGDFPIAATGVRDADTLVLGLLSYFDLTPLFKDEDDTHTLAESLDLLDADQVKVMVNTKGQDYLGFLRLAAESERFGRLRMSHYIDVLLNDPPVQFAAMRFQDDTDLSFIVYRGTDQSLAGWQEDFMISFTRTRAQTQAQAYANAYVETGKRNYLIGHSKGGNEALFAAANLRDSKWGDIEHVYILDGPGLCPEVLDMSGMARVNAKATHIVPVFSIVGKLFAAELDDTRIVQSSGSGFQQHSLITWGIDHGKLAAAEENDPTSRWLNAAVDSWIGDVEQADRATLVNDLFESLAAGGADSLDDLSAGGLGGLEPVLKRMKSSSDTTRKLLGELPKYAVKQTVETIRSKFTKDGDPEAEDLKPAEPMKV